MKFFGRGRGPGTNQLDFDGNPGLDPGSMVSEYRSGSHFFIVQCG